METDDAWIWASADDMLHWMIAKYKLKVTEKPQMLAPGTLVTYSREKGKWTCNTEELRLTSTTYSGKWCGYNSESSYTPPEAGRNILPWTGSRTLSRITGIEEDFAEKLMAHYTYVESQKVNQQFKNGDVVQMQCLDVIPVLQEHGFSEDELYNFTTWGNT